MEGDSFYGKARKPGALHVARRSIGNRDREHRDGCRVGGGYDNDLQCGLRTLCAAVVQHAQPDGRQDQRYRIQLADHPGVSSLRGTEHKLLPDMIEIGSFIGLAAMTVRRSRSKKSATRILESSPVCSNAWYPDGTPAAMTLHSKARPLRNRNLHRRFDPEQWPTRSGRAFTPDLLSVILVTATQVAGTVLVHRKMFESRLFFVDKLIDMGAQIILCDPHRATVIGLNCGAPLRAIQMTSPDIRAGVALLIAAIVCQRKERHPQHRADRPGYQRIDERLNAIGAQIRGSEPPDPKCVQTRN